MIILVANIKGGMARTTISVMLARAFSQAGKKVILADTTVGGDSARYVENMKEFHRIAIPFEVRKFPDAAYSHRQDFSKGSAKLRTSIQSLEESVGSKGVVIVDTASHHEDILRSLDHIADSAVIPYDYSWAALDPTLHTIDALTTATIVLPHGRSPTVDDGDIERLNQVAKKADHVSSVALKYDEKYTRCGIPDSTSEYDQLVSILSELNDFTATEEDAEADGIKEADPATADVVVQLNTRTSLRYRRLLTQLSRDTGKTIRSLIEEALENAYL